MLNGFQFILLSHTFNIHIQLNYIPTDCLDITDGASETDEIKLPVESYLVNCLYCISSAIASICFNFSG